ncbi:TnsA-like heteromeric transposase endonuclease subunit [Leifsonia sp. NPDC058292]|uniref:TnsA-like heteromeric transposase endonuclease subunit n=1 Tax=Leifsonia sp. NPDC058292 TaxID=3346428 RepID=UPI0036DAB20C
MRHFDAFRHVLPLDEPSIHWLDTAGDRHEVRASSDALRAPLEQAVPCRRGAKFQGQSSYFGHYLFAQTGQWLWFESKAEENALRLLDHIASLSALSTQSFCLVHPDGLRHVPDFFGLSTDGERIVYDVRPEELRNDAVEQFRRTAEICSRIGWTYQVMTGEDKSVPAQNVKLLANFRAPDFRPSLEVHEVVRGALSRNPFMTWETFFDAFGHQVSYPDMYALMWQRKVGYTFGAPIGPHTRVWWVKGA